jgi:shikimate dehydrogenase
MRDAAYELFPIGSIGSFPDLWKNNPELEGMNVTIPYKEAVLPYLDAYSEVVRETGACNCIRKTGGRLVGHNTDVIGFERTLLEKRRLHQDRALVLGTGGAARAVVYVLKKHGIAFQQVSRHPSAGQLAYDQLDSARMAECTLIINTTPLGMYPAVDQCPPIPYEGIGPGHLLIDLVYNPPLTQFMERGMQRGAEACNGERMLIVQAEESWKIWNGR